MTENYYGILFALSASILWSITVTLIKPISNNISPFLINPIKNSVGLLLFFISVKLQGAKVSFFFVQAFMDFVGISAKFLRF